jgi:molybdopterin/thiamine biosynthesis adenylyltransferase
MVDLTQYALANKLLLEKSFRLDVPVIRAFCRQQGGEEGLKVFAYRRGREWQELREMVSPTNLPGQHHDDGVLDLVAAGLALEETKNIVMGHRVSEDLVAYGRPKVMRRGADARVCVVGAGALGNFVGLGLAFAGARAVTVFDPDAVDVTNLNRQVLLADGIGRSKAQVLCERLQVHWGIQADARVAPFRRDTQLAGYDAVFDCVDNFETRIVLSDKCRDEGTVLISGGTSADAGQVTVYDPARRNRTPAELLGLHELVKERQSEGYNRETSACAHRPEPSVIMVNQIIGGLMVDAWRRLIDGQAPESLFYDSKSDKRM